MPAMPKEKTSPLTLENSFSDKKVKEQYVPHDCNTTKNEMAKESNNSTDNKEMISTMAVSSDSVLSPKKQPNNLRKYIDDCKINSSKDGCLSSPPQTFKSVVSANNNISEVPARNQNQSQQSTKSTTTTTSSPTATLANNAKTPSKKTANDFIFGKYIGEGSFSTVYLAREINTHREYASELNENYNYIQSFSFIFLKHFKRSDKSIGFVEFF